MDLREVKADALKALYESIQRDPGYRSSDMGSVFVPGDGRLQDDLIVFIGEAPGRDEEKQRRPFVGATGRNLSTLLQGIGFSRSDVYITNLVKYRPFNPDGSNRAPTPKESRTALPYLLEELKILAPCLIVCLGLSAAKALLEAPTLRMGEANGEIFEKDGLRVLVTYHPSPYNYKFEDKRKAMEAAFQKIKGICAR